MSKDGEALLATASVVESVKAGGWEAAHDNLEETMQLARQGRSQAAERLAAMEFMAGLKRRRK